MKQNKWRGKMDSSEESKVESKNEETQPVEAKTEEPEKTEPKTEPSKVESASPTATTAAVKKSGSGIAVIIVVVIVVLAVVGVGGFFGVKYLLNKYSNKASIIDGLRTAIPATGSVSVKSILEKLMYPGATIGDQKQDKDSTYKAEMTLNASDSVANIKAYYIKLTTDKGWQITRQGSSGDDNYYLTITDNVFVAEIDITKYTGYDTTDIDIDLSGDKLVADGIYVPSASTTVTSSLTKTTTTVPGSSDYIISDSSTRVIAESELTGFTPWQLKVARNEIYARHGREFVHKDLQCYFAKKTWYKADANFSESSLSTTENKNVATIQSYENKTSSPLASSDSGCNTNQ